MSSQGIKAEPGYTIKTEDNPHLSINLALRQALSTLEEDKAAALCLQSYNFSKRMQLPRDNIKSLAARRLACPDPTRGLTEKDLRLEAFAPSLPPKVSGTLSGPTPEFAPPTTAPTSPSTSFSSSNSYYDSSYMSSSYSSPVSSRKSTIDERMGDLIPTGHEMKKSKTTHSPSSAATTMASDVLVSHIPVHSSTFPTVYNPADRYPSSSSSMPSVTTGQALKSPAAKSSHASDPLKFLRLTDDGVCRRQNAPVVPQGIVMPLFEYRPLKPHHIDIVGADLAGVSVDLGQAHSDYTEDGLESASLDTSSTEKEDKSLSIRGTQKTTGTREPVFDADNWQKSPLRVCKSYGDAFHDIILDGVLAVILKNTPSDILEDLEDQIRIIAVWCAEKAINLIQAQVNEGSHDHHYTTCSGAPSCDKTTGPAQFPGLPAGAGSGSSKDKPGDDEADPGDQGHEQPNKQGGVAGLKRKREGQPPQETFSCPFRKRNPLRFNIRDFQSCATQTFVDMARLKRHIKDCHKHHRLPFVCPRCKIGFHSDALLTEHLSVPATQICSLRDPPKDNDPENGISDAVANMLSARGNTTKVDKWETLWQTLFPNDTRDQIPPPSLDLPVELDEVRAVFNKMSGAHRDNIQSCLASISDKPELLGAMIRLYEEHIEMAFSISQQIPYVENEGHSQYQRAKRAQMRRRDVPSLSGSAQTLSSTQSDPLQLVGPRPLAPAATNAIGDADFATSMPPDMPISSAINILDPATGPAPKKQQQQQQQQQPTPYRATLSGNMFTANGLGLHQTPADVPPSLSFSSSPVGAFAADGNPQNPAPPSIQYDNSYPRHPVEDGSLADRASQTLDWYKDGVLPAADDDVVRAMDTLHGRLDGGAYDVDTSAQESLNITPIFENWSDVTGRWDPAMNNSVDVDNFG